MKIGRNDPWPYGSGKKYKNHPLHNRTLHIGGTFKETEKANIEDAFTAKTASHV